MVGVLVNSIYLYNYHKHGVLRDLFCDFIVISIKVDKKVDIKQINLYKNNIIFTGISFTEFIKY